MFVKNFFRNLWHGVFLSFLFFVVLIVLSSSINAAVPTVIGAIPNQQALERKLFSMSFDIHEIFSDADNDALSVTITKADDSALPAWLTAEPKPLASSLVGTFDKYGEARGVTVVGNYAYVAAGLSGLKIIDVSIPSSPSLVGTCDISGYVSGVAVAGDYAYVTGWESSRLQIIDVSIPSSPSLVGTCYVGNAQGVTVVGNYAYVAAGYFGLRIIDVSILSSRV